jgi:putative nucleotidyltransferase with HDIG domain
MKLVCVACMLKRISSRKLKPGMYLHQLCGDWSTHPFWRSSFILKDTQTITTILSTAIEEVIIDTSKGLDVDDCIERDTPKGNTKTTASAALKKAQKKHPAPNRRKEWDQAKAICDDSKKAVESMFQDARLGKVVNIGAVRQIVDNVTSASLSSCDSLISIARIKTCDNYTYMHSVAVCAMMIALARELGLNAVAINQAGISGLMHDLGKTMMPITVLNKPGKLTDDEFAIMKTHPEEGYKLLKNSDQIDPKILDVILHHHEKYDGTGYPSGLQGDAISLFSRMAAVCDVYDAVTSTRPYKNGWEPAKSLKLMVSWKGHFDPKILQAFIKSVGIYPVGSLIKLESGRLGIVLEQNTGKLLTPKVKVFFSTRPTGPISVEQIDLSASRCKDRIVGLEEAANWQFINLHELCIPD